MDQNQGREEEPTVYFPDPPIYKQKWVKIALFIALSPLLVLAFLWLKELPFFQSQIPPAPPPIATSSASIKEEDLPIALDILKNPLVYEWRGSVEGVLVAKDEKSITLEKDDQRITILIDRGENGTRFSSNKATKDFRSTPLTFDDLKIGDFLRGSIWIFPKQKDQIIGNAFSVIGQ